MERSHRPHRSARVHVRIAAPSECARVVYLARETGFEKRRFIERSFETREILLAEVTGDIVGYAIWDRSFFSLPFLWLLGVHPTMRRKGCATALLDQIERDCAGEKLFTSTNQSNSAMQALCERRGFVPSGRIDNIDEGDPELFYFKRTKDIMRAIT